MNRKFFIIFLVALLILSSCTAQNTPEPEPEQNIDARDLPPEAIAPVLSPEEQNTSEKEEAVSPPSTPIPAAPSFSDAGIDLFAYAYANDEGNLLKVLDKDEDSKLLSYYQYALGEQGNIYPIEYVRYDEESPDSTGREIMQNFDNRHGCVYQIAGGNVLLENMPENLYVLLTEEALSSIDVMQGTVSFFDDTVPADVIEQCEQKADRKVNNAWPLAQYGSGQEFYIIAFESIGNDVLYWLAFIYGQELKYYESHSTLDDYVVSGWTRDEYGAWVLEKYVLSLMAAIQVDNEIVLFTTYLTEEMQNICVITFSNEEKASESIKLGRYIYPV